jgi:serine/threonine protein kinase
MAELKKRPAPLLSQPSLRSIQTSQSLSDIPPIACEYKVSASGDQVLLTAITALGIAPDGQYAIECELVTGKVVRLDLSQPKPLQTIDLNRLRNLRVRNLGIPAESADISPWYLTLDDSDIVREEVGSGATGQVYKAVHRVIQDVVAVKQVRAGDELSYQREVAVMATVKGQTILPLLGCTPFSADAEPKGMILTPLMETGSLEAVLEQVRSGNAPAWWSATTKLKILLGTAIGVKLLAEHRILHRNLTPQNIVLDRNREPKICGFGLAIHVPVGVSGQPPKGTGAHLYLAPEIVRGEQYGFQSDVFSLGLLIYSVWTGLPPFANADGQPLDPVVACDLIASGKRPEFPESTPKPLVTLAKRCWSRSPDRRPEIGKLVADLQSPTLVGSIPELSHDDYREYQLTAQQAPTAFPTPVAPASPIDGAPDSPKPVPRQSPQQQLRAIQTSQAVGDVPPVSCEYIVDASGDEILSTALAALGISADGQFTIECEMGNGQVVPLDLSKPKPLQTTIDLNRLRTLKVRNLGIPAEFADISKFFLVLDESDLARKPLGSGTSGEVYKGIQRITQQVVAVKQVRVADELSYQREVATMATVKAPTILPVIGCTPYWGGSDTKGMILSPLMETGSLEGVLEQVRSGNAPDWWNSTTKLKILLGTAVAVKLLNDRRILHRNVTTGNIVLDKNHEPKLCGFGLATHIPVGVSGPPPKGTGAHLYLAPEIIRGEPYGFQSDVFSLGMLIYSVWTARPPFQVAPGQALDAVAACNLIASDKRPEFPANAPKPLVTLARRCWARNPDRRPLIAKVVDELQNAALLESIPDLSPETYQEYQVIAQQPSRPVSVAGESDTPSAAGEAPEAELRQIQTGQSQSDVPPIKVGYKLDASGAEILSTAITALGVSSDGRYAVECEMSNKKVVRLDLSKPQPLQTIDLNRLRTLKVRNLGIPAESADISKLYLTLDQFHLVRPPLGSGASGEVYKGIQRVTQEVVAVKQVRAGDELSYQREIATMAVVKTPTILPVVGCTPWSGGSDTKGIIVTPLMETGSLEGVLDQVWSGTAPDWWNSTTKLKILLGTAIGVKLLADHRVIHRNLTPQNILLDINREPKLCGFGLATHLPVGVSGQPPKGTGAHLYLAPEIIRGESYGLPSDVFSVGLLIYAVWTGEPPYSASPGHALNPVAACNLIASGKRPEFPADAPAPLVNLAKRCWDNDPDARPDMGTVTEELQSGALLDSMPRDLSRENFREYRDNFVLFERLGCLRMPSGFTPSPSRGGDR